MVKRVYVTQKAVTRRAVKVRQIVRQNRQLVVMVALKVGKHGFHVRILQPPAEPRQLVTRKDVEKPVVGGRLKRVVPFNPL